MKDAPLPKLGDWVVSVTQHAVNPQISSYVDALYFTIATLTPTGFGKHEGAV